MSGYAEMFKETLSPCYDNVQKKGWHGGKRKTTKKKSSSRKTTKKTSSKSSSKSTRKSVSKTSRKSTRKTSRKSSSKSRKQRGGGDISTCQSTVPTWHDRGVPQGRAADTSYGRNIYQFTRTLPNGKLYTAFNYGQTQSCGKNYPDLVPKVGGGKVKMTIGKDGRKYFFKNGKRVKNM